MPDEETKPNAATMQPDDSVRIDASGVAWIADTTTKVVEVVRDYLYWQLTPQQIQAEHPHLSIPQVMAALRYYADHQAEIEEDIERRNRTIDAMRAQARNQPTRQELQERLRQRGVERPA